MSGAVFLEPPCAEAGGQYMSAAAEEKNSIVNNRGALVHLAVTNVKSSTVYVCVFDNTTNGGTLLYPPIQVATNAHVEIPLIYGVKFGTGLYIASSSAPTYTATSSSDLWIHARYQRWT